MEKIIVFFIPLLFLIACGPNKQELAQKQAVIDSLKNENANLQKEELEKIKRDSIAKVEAFQKVILDSLAAVKTQDSLAALKRKGENNEGKGARTFAIGDNYAGGIIFYLDGSGQHGLVCAPNDQSSSAEWGCFGTVIDGTATYIGSGQANTQKIVNACSQSGIAARICSNLVLNGYSDWFLPSKDELNLMFKNLKQIGLGNFSDNWYWSSSEYVDLKTYTAWGQDFSSGDQYDGGKHGPRDVRAVRAF